MLVSATRQAARTLADHRLNQPFPQISPAPLWHSKGSGPSDQTCPSWRVSELCSFVRFLSLIQDQACAGQGNAREQNLGKTALFVHAVWCKPPEPVAAAAPQARRDPDWDRVASCDYWAPARLPADYASEEHPDISIFALMKGSTSSLLGSQLGPRRGDSESSDECGQNLQVVGVSPIRNR
jgi:hypothetical protein